MYGTECVLKYAGTMKLDASKNEHIFCGISVSAKFIRHESQKDQLNVWKKKPTTTEFIIHLSVEDTALVFP